MGLDTKPNLDNSKFEQFPADVLDVSGSTNIYGSVSIENSGCIDSKNGYYYNGVKAYDYTSDGTILAGSGTTSSGVTSVLIGNDMSYAGNSLTDIIMIGGSNNNCTADIQQKNVSIGYGNLISGATTLTEQILIGNDSESYCSGSVTLGADNINRGYQSVSIGSTNTTSSSWAIVVGSSNLATKSRAISIGCNVDVDGDSSIAIGVNTTVTETQSITLGVSVNNTAGQSIAIGGTGIMSGLYGIGIGYGMCNAGCNSVAIGRRAYACSANNVAIGACALANNNSGIAIGYRTCVDGIFPESLAIGSNSCAFGLKDIIVGDNNCACAPGSILIGTCLYDNNVGCSVTIGLRTQNPYTESFGLGWQDTALENPTILLAQNRPSYLMGDNPRFGFGLMDATARVHIVATGATDGFILNDGNQGLGKVLTSDANGVGTWQDSGGGTITGATNGLSVDGDNIKLGGDLTETTTIENCGNFFNIYGGNYLGQNNRNIFEVAPQYMQMSSRHGNSDCSSKIVVCTGQTTITSQYGVGFDVPTAGVTVCGKESNISFSSSGNVRTCHSIDGFVYTDDYSGAMANNARWLPDLGYVTGLTSGLGVGTITGGTNGLSVDGADLKLGGTLNEYTKILNSGNTFGIYNCELKNAFEITKQYSQNRIGDTDCGSNVTVTTGCTMLHSYNYGDYASVIVCGTDNVVRINASGNTVKYDGNGLKYETDHSVTESNNPRWLPDLGYVTGLTSGGGSGENVTSEVNQTLHGFNIGDFIGWSGGTYNKAIADGTYDGEFIGIVSDVVDAHTFKVTQSGFVSGFTGLVTDSTYWLSATVSGQITDVEPTAEGSILKSVLIANSSTTAWVLPYVGHYVTSGGTTQIEFVDNGLSLNGSTVELGGQICKTTDINLGEYYPLNIKGAVPACGVSSESVFDSQHVYFCGDDCVGDVCSTSNAFVRGGGVSLESTSTCLCTFSTIGNAALDVYSGPLGGMVSINGFGDTCFRICDETTSKDGLQYDKCISTGFTSDCSLVDKGYVDNAIGNATSSEYTLNSPATCTVGGITAGTTLTGKTLECLLQDILAPYIQPTFNTFSISQPTYTEVGTVVSGTRTFTWGTTSPTNVKTNSVCICDVTNTNQLASGLANDGNEVMAINNMLNTAPSTWTWRIDGESTDDTNFNSTINRYSIYPIYWGVETSGSRPAVTNGLVTGGNKVLTPSTSTVTVDFDSSSQWTWVAIPQASPSKTCWYVSALNNGGVGNPGDKYPDECIIPITSAQGCWSAVNYKIYMSGFAASDADPIQFRNS